MPLKKMFKLCPKCDPEAFKEAVLKYKAKTIVQRDPVVCPIHHIKLVLFHPNRSPGVSPLNYYFKTRIERGEI